jgi:hypothetical protein
MRRAVPCGARNGGDDGVSRLRWITLTASALAVVLPPITTSALEVSAPGASTFADLEIGDQGDAMISDFCSFGHGFHLIVDRAVLPEGKGEVFLRRDESGVVVVMRKTVETSDVRVALFGLNAFWRGAGDACSDPTKLLPMITIGVEGLSIVDDEEGQPILQLKGTDP